VREIDRVVLAFDHRLKHDEAIGADASQRIASAQRLADALRDDPHDVVASRTAGTRADLPKSVDVGVHERETIAVAPRRDERLLDAVCEQHTIRKAGEGVGECRRLATQVDEGAGERVADSSREDIAVDRLARAIALDEREFESVTSAVCRGGDRATQRLAFLSQPSDGLPDEFAGSAADQRLGGGVCSQDPAVAVAEQRRRWGLIVERGQDLSRRRKLHRELLRRLPRLGARFAERGAMTPEEIAAFVDGLDERALRLVAAAVAQRAGNGKARRGDFWERLAGAERIDEATARDEARAAGVRLAPAYLAIALELDAAPESDEIAELRRLARDVFTSSGDELGFIEREGGVELLVPVPREVDASKARTAATLLPKTIAKRRAGVRVSGGVGCAAPPSESARNLQCARYALAIGRRIFGPGRVNVYDDLGAYALLYSGASTDELRDFSRRVLAPLREYDDKHQTELEKTLRLYFDNRQNVQTAAAALNVHRHTVFYRLRQIAEICGCDLGTAHDQLTLRLAMAIDVLHS
jgi:DNA-binding PucR family transcriptional regulator